MYQALYRKWRPKLFDDVVGQEHITQTLKNQVVAGRLSHAYLFTGTRGTGKTTCAKILAKAVNCQHPVAGNPCGKCPACLGIDSGSILDVVELDAASNNGVDQVRALRDEAVYSPAAVKKRVYIVDEVHMLSVAAFNALLKILEEPPEHLMFILATTELHKVPATILSRCQRFSFKRIQPIDIQNRLTYIAQNEGIDLTDDGAALLARLADGALRDALSLLDQCAISGRRVDRDAVLDTLGLAGNLRTAHLMDHIRRQRTAEALNELTDLYAAGKDVSAVLDELSGLTRDLLLRQTAGTNASALMGGGYDEGTLKALSRGLSPQRLLHMLTLLQNTLAGLKTSVNRKTDAELCLIRLCDPRLDGSVLSLSERLSRIEATLASGALPAAAPVPQEEPGPQMEDPLPAVPEPEELSSPVPEVSPASPPTEAAPAPVQAPPSEELTRKASRPTPRRTGAPAQQTPPPAGDARFWEALIPSLRRRVGQAVFSYIRQRMVTGVYANGVLHLSAADETIRQRLMMERIHRALEEAASAQAGRSVRVLVSDKPLEQRITTPTTPSPSVPAGPDIPPFPMEEPPLPEAPPAEPPAAVPPSPEEDPLDDVLAFAAGPGKEIITVE